MIKKLSAPLVAAALSVGATACGSSDGAATDVGSADSSEQPVSGEVTVTDAWIREPADGQTLAAGYGTVMNGSDETITLVGASVPIGGIFEIHETSAGDDGIMSMSEKEDGFEIAAGESFVLEPGGAHIMMMEIDPTKFIDPIDLTFVFDATEVTVAAELRAIGDAMEGMDDDSMDDDSMDDADS